MERHPTMTIWNPTIAFFEELADKLGGGAMRYYDRPLKAYLFSDLSAVEEHHGELIYFFEKGYVKVLGEFEHEKYGGGTACIIFNEEDVISVSKKILRFVDENQS